MSNWKRMRTIFLTVFAAVIVNQAIFVTKVNNALFPEGFSPRGDLGTSIVISKNKKTPVIQHDAPTNNRNISKLTRTNTTQVSLPTPRPRRIIFMHVGKTGGSTLRESIIWYGCKIKGGQNRIICEENIQKLGLPQSRLSNYTRGIHHFKDHWGTPLQDATDFLFTVREPISRFESWYAYQRHGQKDESANRASFSHRVWEDCFPTMYRLTEALNPSMSAKIICRSILREMFHSVGAKRYGHIAAGYRFYKNLAELGQHYKTVWAVRMEHMRQDLEVVDKLLGGDGNFGPWEDLKKTHGSEQYKDDRSNIIPDGDIVYVCCALWPEFLAYRDILERAENLDSNQAMETFRLSWRRCNNHVTSWDSLELLCRNMDFDLQKMS